MQIIVNLDNLLLDFYTKKIPWVFNTYEVFARKCLSKGRNIIIVNEVHEYLNRK